MRRCLLPALTFTLLLAAGGCSHARNSSELPSTEAAAVAASMAAATPAASPSLVPPRPAGTLSPLIPTPRAQSGAAFEPAAPPTRVATGPSGPTVPPATPLPAGGVLTVLVGLSATQCSSGTVTATVDVKNSDGRPVSGAAVSGRVDLVDSVAPLSFPPTDFSGRTHADVNVGHPRSGAYLFWTVTVRRGDAAGAGSALCPGPK